MKVIEKILGKKDKKEEKKEECWYNNAHELPKDKWVETPEGGAFSSPNSYFYSTAQQAAKQQ